MNFRKRWSIWVVLIVLTLAGILLFVGGELIRNNLLQGLSGVLGGAALSLFITIVTSREAVSQQNAKEANIERKNAYYIPMFNDLKQVYDALENAQQRRLPYPQWISGVDTEQRTPVWGKYPIPIFANWKTFREQPYRSNFTEKACVLFNEVQETSVTYNQAVSNAKKPVVNILNPQIDKAFHEWANTDDFKRWQEETKNGSVWSSHQYHRWNAYIYQYLQRPSSADYNEAQAIVWMHNILGWVLADDIDKASEAMQKIYQNDFQTFTTPDTLWFKSMLESAWAKLQELPSIKEVSKSVGDLFLKTGKAKNYMQERFDYMRDIYEGGEPPL